MIALNTQPIEKEITSREDGSLDVIKVWKTLQGEGPLAGTPAFFIRTAGCDLLCPKCDTNYTKGRKLQTPDEIMKEIYNLDPRGISLIVITGGEPFRQSLIKFVEQASRHFKVQIETNGTIWQEQMADVAAFREVSIVCSPKTPKIAIPNWAVTAFKYILQDGFVDPEDGLPTSSLESGLRPYRPSDTSRLGMYSIFVQPMDEQDEEKNKKNTQASLTSCMKFGYRLSLQTHKTLGLD